MPDVSLPTPPPARFEHDWYIEALRPEVAGFVAAVTATDLDESVPPCPGWSVSDLAAHLGRVHRWATHLVATRADEFVSPKQFAAGTPEDPAELRSWVDAGGAALLEALAATPGDTPVWAWGRDQHARFWSRRQLHETAMHRADAELAGGGRPAIATEVALDGVDELLALWTAVSVVPDKVRADGHVGDTIHLHATDAADGQGEWTFTVTDGGFTWSHDHAKGAVAVRATASDLLLALSNRISLDDPALEVFGDTTVLEHWRAATAI